MSVIKELKLDPANNVNFVDIVQKFILTDKTKYIELYLKLFKNEFDDVSGVSSKKIELTRRMERRLTKKTGQDVTLGDMSLTDVIFLNYLLENFASLLNVEYINEFIILNEDNLIENKDLTRYKTFDEMKGAIGLANLRKFSKQLEKQVFKIYDDEEWVVVRPLTAEASNKYGSGSEWCTSSTTNPSTFYDYTQNGILIYCIHKKTGFKVAAHMYCNDSFDISFWNQNSGKVESFFCGLPSQILDVLKEHIRKNNIPNYDYCDDKLKEEYNKHLMKQKCSEGVCVTNDMEDPPLRGNEPITEGRPITATGQGDGSPHPMMRDLIPDDGPSCQEDCIDSGN